jgi:hypothetical protein
MYDKAKTDTTLAKAAFMKRYSYGMTWGSDENQKVINWYREVNNY